MLYNLLIHQPRTQGLFIFQPQNIDENEDKQVAEAEATNVSEEIHEETKGMANLSFGYLSFNFPVRKAERKILI
jgi:hypothetical protein